MRIIFDHPIPFQFAHGGFEIQVEETRNALQDSGSEVEFLRWWDDTQDADLIHFFGLPTAMYAKLARKKGIKLIITNLLGGLGARSRFKRLLQQAIIGIALRTLPDPILMRAGWSAWQTADAYVAVTSWEAKLMEEVFRVPTGKIHIVPNGVGDVFFSTTLGTRGEYLVTTASILPVKRLFETALAAVAAKTPYWIIGRPFSEKDDYYQRFSRLCREHPNILRYDNTTKTHMELSDVYAQARGFVLLSHWESQSLSALEAAACKCPLLLSDLPWSHATFGPTAMYCPLVSPNRTAYYLRTFYDEAPSLPTPSPPARWSEVAAILTNLYQRILGAS